MSRIGWGTITCGAALLALSAPALAGRGGGCDDAKARTAQASTAALEDAVACLLNAERRKAGLRRVSGNRRLETAAIRHARDMRDRDYFSHTSVDGRSFSQRIMDAGYMRGQERGPWKVGETLAWGTGTMSTPAQLVANLMASPPHREVILDGDYREIGVGIVRGTPTPDETGVTLVVDFGSLAGTPPPPPQAEERPADDPPAPQPDDRGDDDRDDRGDRGERDHGRGHGRGRHGDD
jgi:uncharacterized protein YkwD